MYHPDDPRAMDKMRQHAADIDAVRDALDPYKLLARAEAAESNLAAERQRADALAARGERLEKALEPFKLAADQMDSDTIQPDGSRVGHRMVALSPEDCFRARAALAEPQP